MMAITPRLEIRQGQSLVMTPQLQQAIKMLQLSNVELTEFVEQELEKNPLLERDEGDGVGATSPSEAEMTAPDGDVFSEVSQGVAPDGGPESEESGSLRLEDTGSDVGEANAALDVDYDNPWTENTAGEGAPSGPPGGSTSDTAFATWSARGGRFEGGYFSLEDTLPDSVTLRDHLLGQLHLDIVDPVDRIIGTHLIGMVDEAGYIPADLSALAGSLGCDEARVEATLEQLQKFDPPGIFARSLGECLSLQLKDRNRLDPAIQALLDNLELLAKQDIAALRRLTGEDDEGLAEMVAEVRALDPKPAQAFEHTIAQPVIPDVLMRPLPSGGWLVELNPDTLPRVLVNNQYYTEVTGKVRAKEEKKYINECFQSASWLIKSLNQRATTILKVASEIIRQQEMFFTHGVAHLRPLVLRDVAEAIEMHESTVSRVTSNKYIATPRGIYELKYFFTTAINSVTGGEAHSAEAVRYKIKTLIKAEDLKSILSDDKIVTILKNDGVDIARRTVAKYRESMGISSSVQRRRNKKSSL